MFLSDLQEKEIISIETGLNYSHIVDCEIDEEGKINTTIDQLTSIPFLDTSGNSVTANFGINIAELIELLRERIEKGCEKFLNSLKEALFDNNEKFPQEVKIILAGNASRSQIAMELFNVLDNLQNTNTKQNTTITITNENTYDGLATIDNIDTIKNTNIISSYAWLYFTRINRL